MSFFFKSVKSDDCNMDIRYDQMTWKQRGSNYHNIKKYGGKVLKRYHIRTPQCDKGSPVFRKSIYSLVGDDKQLAADFYLIHYMGDETAYVPHKHGNAKTNRTFILTKKQVFSDILLHDQGQAPSNIYKAVLAKASTNDQEQMPVNCPRNLKQVQNTVYAQRCKDRISHDEIFSLHELAYQLPGFIWHITTFPDLLVYAGMPDIVDLACANLEESVKFGYPQIISYDTTFEMGDFYVSILAMRNTALVNDPVFPVGFMLHEWKFMQNHEQFLTDILGKLGMDSTKLKKKKRLQLTGKRELWLL